MAASTFARSHALIACVIHCEQAMFFPAMAWKFFWISYKSFRLCLCAHMTSGWCW